MYINYVIDLSYSCFAALPTIGINAGCTRLSMLTSLVRFNKSKSFQCYWDGRDLRDNVQVEHIKFLYMEVLNGRSSILQVFM